MTSPFGWLGVVGGASGPGPAAATWSLAEKAKYPPKGQPTAARIAEYFEPAVRDGAKGRFKLNMMEGNWCAAGACFAASRVVGTDDLEKAGLPHAYRVSGKELEEDAIKHNAWLPAAEVLKGVRPSVGDLAVYNRGDPNDWTRHVARVVELGEKGYASIDANGPGGWALIDKQWDAPNLRGFIRYPTGTSGLSSKEGVGAGLIMVAVGAAFVWAALRVRPGKLTFRSNPTTLSPHHALTSEEGWLYHATNEENAHEIARTGSLQTFRPWDGTDQDSWPDGGRGKRAYFSKTAHSVWSFAPEYGRGVILRTRATKQFKKEAAYLVGIEDYYTTKPVPASSLEILTDEGWLPLLSVM